MDATRFGISSCQRCRFYTPEGRRGGYCSQLNAPVQGRWSPCPLAVPVFFEPISVVSQAQITAWREGLAMSPRDPQPLESRRLSQPA